MNIIEATKQALELNTAFYQIDKQIDYFVGVIPLKEPFFNLLIVMPSEYLYRRPESTEEWKKVHLCGGWNPNADEILSDQWEVLENSEFKVLTNNGTIVQDNWWTALKATKDITKL